MITKKIMYLRGGRQQSQPFLSHRSGTTLPSMQLEVQNPPTILQPSSVLQSDQEKHDLYERQSV